MTDTDATSKRTADKKFSHEVIDYRADAAPKVVIVDPTGDGFASTVVRLIENTGSRVVTSRATTEEDVIDAVHDADGIIFNGTISRRFMESLTHCKVIARGSIGMDPVDGMDVATAKGIVFCNMPGIIEEEVADATMALLLATTRAVLPFDRYVREGCWARGEKTPSLPIQRLFGSVLGLIGLGGIGQAVARRAIGFGLRLLAYDPFLPSDAFAAHGAMPATLGQILQDSDFVSLHVPLTSQTHHLIGNPELRLMRSHSVLINTCRGSVIDEQALITALNEGWIGGAGLDVMEQEPIGTEHPLCQFSNVVLAPHCASRSQWADAERLIRPAQEVVAVLAGLRPRAIWNPEVLQRLELR